MESATTSLETPGAALPDPPSAIDATIGVIVAPGETFGTLAASRPSWACLVPWLLAIFVGVFGGYLYVHRVDMEQVVREQMRRGPHSSEMSTKQIDDAAKTGAKFARFGPYFGVPMNGIYVLLLAAIFLLGMTVLGDRITFGNTFRVVCWAQTPRIFYYGLYIVMIFLKDPTNFDPNNPIMTNLAAVLGRDRLSSPLYALLSDLDIFSFWWLWIASVGLAAFAHARIGKGATVVFGTYAIYMLIHVGLSFLF